MSNYTNNPYSCRVDIFKPSGKWYTTEDVTFRDESYSTDLNKVCRSALKDSFEGMFKGMTAVFLQPYNQFSHPTSFII